MLRKVSVGLKKALVIAFSPLVGGKTQVIPCVIVQTDEILGAFGFRDIQLEQWRVKFTSF